MYCSVLHHPSLRSAKLFPLCTRKRVIVQSDNEGPQWPEVKFQDVVVGEILSHCLYETVGFPCSATWFIVRYHFTLLLHGVTCWSGSAEAVKNFHKEFLLLFGSADCSRTNRAGGHATSHCHGCLYWAGENVRHRVTHKHAWVLSANEWKGGNFLLSEKFNPSSFPVRWLEWHWTCLLNLWPIAYEFLFL